MRDDGRVVGSTCCTWWIFYPLCRVLFVNHIHSFGVSTYIVEYYVLLMALAFSSPSSERAHGSPVVCHAKSLGHIILSLKSVLNGWGGVNSLPCFVGHNRGCTYTYIHGCNGIRKTVVVLFRSASCNMYSKFLIWTAAVCVFASRRSKILSLSLSSKMHLAFLDGFSITCVGKRIRFWGYLFSPRIVRVLGLGGRQ